MKYWLPFLILAIGVSQAWASAFDDPPPPPALSGVASQYYSGTGVFSVPSGAGSTGNIVGSGATVVGHPGCWNNTTATALIDCTFPSVNLTTATPTNLSGLLKGNGSTLVVATAGTDYLAPAGSGAALTGLTWSQIGSTPTTLTGYGISNGTGVAAAIANAVNAAGGLGTIGTSGGTVGLLNGNLTFSGNDIFSGLLTFSGLSSGTQVVCLGLTSGNALVTSAGACGSGGGGGLTINSTTISGGSANHILFDDGTKLQEAAPGVGLAFNGSTLNTTAPVETAQTASFSVAAGDMGKTTPVNISGGGTITLPLSGAFSTVFGSGQTWCGINTGATADTVTNSTGGTMTPSITSLASGAQLCLQSDGAALYATYTLGAYSGSGTVTTSGSPASGDIAQFSSSTAITTATATGTGSVVRATSPTLVTPALGTPASGNGANLTNIQNAAVTAAPLPTPGAGATLAAPRSYYVCTTTCSMTLPVPAAGDEFCIQNDVGVSTVVTLLGIGSSARYGKTDQSAYGTAGTGTFVSGGATGDKICLLGRDSTHYLTASFNGTWTAN